MVPLLLHVPPFVPKSSVLPVVARIVPALLLAPNGAERRLSVAERAPLARRELEAPPGARRLGRPAGGGLEHPCHLGAAQPGLAQQDLTVLERSVNNIKDDLNETSRAAWEGLLEGLADCTQG